MEGDITMSFLWLKYITFENFTDTNDYRVYKNPCQEKGKALELRLHQIPGKSPCV
jgi:hypothetical protein